MSIFTISDLHLSKVNPKPMDIFGVEWANHWQRIRCSWLEQVAENDIVLIPGDISWAMTLEEALPDILDIAELPGRKIFVKGNHDYWWSSVSKMRSIFPPGIEVIQNDFVDTQDFNICGTRGWLLPGDERFQQSDLKVFNREIARLELSLSAASRHSDKEIITMIHYPPLNDRNESSAFIDMMKKYNVKMCVYGHLHGESLKNVKEGMVDGIEFVMASCDYLGFKLKKICQ